ncbi:hypothetical protein K7G98_23700 [Saccharothrix sp. MB29]|nr:hypothetical protein [Saccharothrix sp. MB29]
MLRTRWPVAAVGDVLLVLTLASQVNQQVTSSVATLQEMQRTGNMGNVRWAPR